MKITVTEERECCQPQDLKYVDGTYKAMKFCVYCGAHHVFFDSEYRKLAVWEINRCSTCKHFLTEKSTHGEIVSECRKIITNGWHFQAWPDFGCVLWEKK